MNRRRTSSLKASKSAKADLRGGIATGAVLAAAVWLAWQIVSVPIAARAPPGAAVRLAPSAQSTLRRAAESEFAAKRYDNARDLAAETLAKAPFDVVALRVFGLTIAQEASGADRADQILTQAGNWSLRDDPSHAWLIGHRLRQGDYGSAFAHADTLARRVEDRQPVVFQLFTTAALSDPRSVAPLVRMLAANPPWRPAYMQSLVGRPETVPLQAALAVNLEGTAYPLNPVELGTLYSSWLAQGRIAGIKEVRRRLNRPAVGRLPTNGSFEDELAMGPLDWQMEASPRFSVLMTEDDARPDQTALRVEMRGDSDDMVSQQLLLLEPGRYRVQGEVRTELGQTPGVGWTVLCYESGVRLGQQPLSPAKPGWDRFSFQIEVPAVGCAAQWLRLNGRRQSGSGDTVAWFDSMEITSLP
ncbi:MAG: hypothetical protein ACK4UQ_01250 [Brevundimonas sp.]